jgi:hypothetical protein
VAVRRAQRRLAQPGHHPEELEEEVGGEVLLHQRHLSGEAAEVGARAEDLLAGSGQDYGPDSIVFPRGLHRLDQCREQLGVERVPLVGTVERHRRHPLTHRVDQFLSHPPQPSGSGRE